MSPEIVLIAASVVVGLYMAWSIGANDVANSMGTSVASGALTLRQAVVVAGICNFIGAVFVGTHVTNTVRKGVLNVSNFTHDPTLLIYGMLAVLLGASIWVTLATYKGLPVSTTHSIIGAVIGFGLIETGIHGIRWYIVAAIVLSWLISPFGGALISYLVFQIIKKTILNAPSPVYAMKKIGPFFVGIVFAILSLATIFKGLKNLHLDLPFPLALFISVGVGILTGFIAYLFLRPCSISEGNEYEQVECLSRPLQIISASYEAFAHGANDVANAIGAITSSVTIHRQVTLGLNEAGRYALAGLPDAPTFMRFQDANAAAIEQLQVLVRDDARRAGTSQTRVEITVEDQIGYAADGEGVFLGRTMEARLSGRPDLARLVSDV